MSEIQIQKSKVVFVVWTNTDLTEGRGMQVPIAVCETRATARRIAKGEGVQGSDAEVRRSLAVMVENQWMADVRIVGPTQDDIKEQRIIDAREAAIAKAKELGMTDEDLKILAGAK